MPKTFNLTAADIKQLVQGQGSCLASDRITVEAHFVGFMYREPPDSTIDSGWRFFAGDETQAFADNPDNFEIYDVNTIANYDPKIIKFLQEPPYSAFERSSDSEEFTQTGFPG